MIIAYLLSLLFVAYTIFLSEKEATAWIFGKREILEKEKLQIYHRRMWAWLFLMIVTGFFLFLPDRDFLLSVPAFQFKMFFVFCLLVNGFALGKLMSIATRHSYKSLAKKEKLPLMISGGVSLLCWLGAFVSAFSLLD